MEYVLSIRVLYPADINQKISEIQRKLGLFYRAKFMTPGCTIGVFRLPESNALSSFDAFRDALTSKNIPTFLCSFTEMIKKEKSEKSLILLAMEKNEALQNIHNSVVEAIQPFRENLMREKDLRRIREAKLQENEIKKLKEFGYTYVFDLFEPHCTLGMVNIENFEKYNSDPENELFGQIFNIPAIELELTKQIDTYEPEEVIVKEIIKLS